MTRVYTQTATSHMVPLECSPTQFEGINAGMLFLGWVFPATRNNPFVRSVVNAGKALAPYFDAFTPAGFNGAPRPETLVSDMRPARLPPEMAMRSGPACSASSWRKFPGRGRRTSRRRGWSIGDSPADSMRGISFSMGPSSFP